MVAKQDNTASESIKPEALDGADIKADDRKVCGIVMPIAAMGDEYSEAHWGRVRRILQRAIERAGLRSQLVWENPEVDVIQTAILQNLFENDVVICDVSNLNPNVMLETGLRLSTKRPTIIITDRVKRPPFDISTIAYIDYPRDLEYNATEDFIGKLSRKIGDVTKAAAEDRYKPYIEQFRFETVQPASVTVTTDEYVKERLDELTANVGRLIRSQERTMNDVKSKADLSEGSKSSRVRYKLLGTISGRFDDKHASQAVAKINSIANVFCHVNQESENIYTFNIHMHPLAFIGADINEIMSDCMNIITLVEADYVLG